MRASCNVSCRTYEWVMLHMWVSHVAHMDESSRSWRIRAYEYVVQCVKSHIWMGNVVHVNESLQAYGWVRSHAWMHPIMCQVTHTNESCHTREWIMANIWMSQVTLVNAWYNASYHIYWMNHVTHVNESWQTYMDASSHTYECIISHMDTCVYATHPFARATWHISRCDFKFDEM